MTNPKSKDGEDSQAVEMGRLAALILKAAEQSGSTLSMARKFHNILEPYRQAAYEQGAKDMRDRAAEEAFKRAETAAVTASTEEFERGWWSAARCIEDEINALPTQREDTRG